ncbi:hypothetical protein [Luteolibacter marinus]|uniref:hypothetical protein n=1 Tax=Luteolibacter marinus TaxID=2776705 RepID=UPI001867FBB9|nr:hypothetical protein [Luteolibacter marinus]
MNATFTTNQKFAATCLAVALAAPCVAMVPDPGNIYFGLAKDFMGNPLTPESTAEVVMIRISAGEEVVLARSPIYEIDTPDGEVNYILRPVLDDGLAGRFDPTAGRKDDEVKIYAIHNGVRYETESLGGCTPISDEVPALAARGAVQKVNFRCIDDWDGDCIADSWEFHHLGTTEFGGTDDWDGDGRNDYQEFIDGTNPLQFDQEEPDPLIVPQLAITTIQEGVVRIEWDEQEGHTYSLQWSGTLEGFTEVPAERIVGSIEGASSSNTDESAPLAIKNSGSEVNIEGLPRMFFRVEVSRE